MRTHVRHHHQGRPLVRNDDTVTAVLINGEHVFGNGTPTQLLGNQRTGRFLRVGV